MAHPFRQRALDDHNSKIKAMTDGYPGSPQKEKPFLRDEIKHGPEQQIAKRAEGGAVKHRADRRAVGGGLKRRETGGGVILRAKGGAAKRADGGDVSSIEEANRDQKMTDGKATGGAVQRASGGRTKGKKGGHTHVNVIVAPQGGGAGAAPMGVHPVPPMLPPGAGPGMPPPGAGAMPPGPMAPRPPMMPPPGAMPPPGGMPPGALATGGRVKRAAGGSVKDPGDRIGESMKEQGLKSSAAGMHVKPGKMPKMDAGAQSGEGRLEKIGKKPHDAGKPQAV